MHSTVGDRPNITCTCQDTTCICRQFTKLEVSVSDIMLLVVLMEGQHAFAQQNMTEATNIKNISTQPQPASKRYLNHNTQHKTGLIHARVISCQVPCFLLSPNPSLDTQSLKSTNGLSSNDLSCSAHALTMVHVRPLKQKIMFVFVSNIA